MKLKLLSIAIVALVAAGGLWLSRSAWRSHALQKSSTGFEAPQDSKAEPSSVAALPGASQGDPRPEANNRPNPRRMLRPPEPNRRFMDFTPEQRVQFARQGHGPGG